MDKIIKVSRTFRVEASEKSRRSKFGHVTRIYFIVASTEEEARFKTERYYEEIGKELASRDALNVYRVGPNSAKTLY
jgi:alkanesulfonate monooxygenase SsuD/methylene tetrahydromethanopterin reductase-like flavin-dependent oxidoreductase (luciferase family)